MKRLSRTIALSALALAAVAVAACQGTGYSPTAAKSSTNSSSNVVSKAAARALRSMGYAVPDAGLPLCTAPAATLPGTYVALIGAGNLHNHRYVGRLTRSFWQEAKYEPTSPPSSDPSASPSILPSIPPVSAYLYYGTFTLNHLNQTGCAYLITTLNHRPIPTTHFNAALAGVPNLQQWFTIGSVVNQGYFVTEIDSLSPSGGSGTIVLKTLGGGTVDSGTITIAGRVTLGGSL